MLIGPFAGAAADRWDRRRALRTGQSLMLAQALALFVLTATGLITIWLLLGLTLFAGVVVAFNQPTRLALVPSLVRREDLTAAVATNSIIFNSARFLGPAAAGVIIVTGGVAAAFAANAACTAALVLALSRIRLEDAGQGRGAGRGGLLAEVGEGLGYAARHGGIAPLLLLLLATGLCARPFVELLPGFADAVFQAGAEGLAAMTSSVGLGAIAGGLWLARRDGPDGLAAVALASPLVLALAIFGFVASDRLWLALPALVLAGFAMVAGGVGTQTLLQLAVEGHLRGRVLALYGLIFRGGPALGALVMGALSDVFGLRLPLAAGASLAALAGAAAFARRRAIAAALVCSDKSPEPQRDARTRGSAAAGQAERERRDGRNHPPPLSPVAGLGEGPGRARHQTAGLAFGGDPPAAAQARPHAAHRRLPAHPGAAGRRRCLLR